MPDKSTYGSNTQDHGSGGSPGRKPRTIKPELFVGIGTLLAGVAAVLGLFIHNAQQGQASSAATGTSSSATTVAETADAATSTSDPSGLTSVQPGVSAGTEPLTQYLADLEPISGGTPDTMPKDIRGTTYLHTISAQTGGCARNQEAVFVYNLGTHFRTFDAVVGLSDQSIEAARVEVRVVADSASVFTGIVSVGRPKTVHVAVTGKLHMTVRQTYLGPNPNLCSEAGDVVWGDARLT